MVLILVRLYSSLRGGHHTINHLELDDFLVIVDHTFRHDLDHEQARYAAVDPVQAATTWWHLMNESSSNLPAAVKSDYELVVTDRPNIKNEASRRQSDSQTTEGQRMWWSILPASWGRAGDRHHSTGFCYAPKTRYDFE